MAGIRQCHGNKIPSVIMSDNSAALSKPLASLDEEIEKPGSNFLQWRRARAAGKDRLAGLPKELDMLVSWNYRALMPLTDGRVKPRGKWHRGKLDQKKRDAI